MNCLACWIPNEEKLVTPSVLLGCLFSRRGGKLLEATNVLGMCTTNSAASPATITPLQPQKFYRIQTQYDCPRLIGGTSLLLRNGNGRGVFHRYAADGCGPWER